jgi:hypothetical protein
MCDTGHKGGFLESFGLRGEVVIMIPVLGSRSILFLQQPPDIERIIQVYGKLPLVVAIGHKAVLAPNSAATNRIKLICQSRAAAGVIMYLGFDLVRIPGIFREAGFRNEGMVL